MDEQRDRLRQTLKKLAFAKNEKGARGGLLRDISAKGAGMEFVNPTGKVEHKFERGDAIEIMIDGFDPIKGEVARTLETGISVKFNLGNEEEKQLIATIMAVANEIDLD